MRDSSVTMPRSFDDIEQAIKAAVYTPIAELRASAWVTPEPVPFAERRQGRSPALYALHYDFEVLQALLHQLPDDSSRAVQLRCALEKAGDLLRDFTKEEAVAARAVLRPDPARRNKAAPLTVWAVGHAHMDLAWLWPIRETIRKCGRTFATALAMLERYPDYIFGASQPQQYAWVKEHYPSLYEGVKQRVAEGRWEVQGAMWVESDI